MKYKTATSFDAKLYFQCYQTCNHQARVLREADLNQENSLKTNAENTPPQTPAQQHELTLNRSQSEPGEEFDEDTEEESPIVPDNQTLLRMLEDNEKVRNISVIVAIKIEQKLFLDFTHVPMCKNSRSRHFRRSNIVWKGTLLCG